MRILLIGGSKSGKSAAAQRIVRKLAQGGPMYYWAAMEPVDREDDERIARHVSDREGWGFATVERGRDLASFPKLPQEASVLFDSVTALLANEMFGGGFDKGAGGKALSELLSLSRSVSDFVCVCDDVFRDGAEFEGYTEEYRRALAFVCRGLAEEFDSVAEVVCGVPRLFKGGLPL